MLKRVGQFLINTDNILYVDTQAEDRQIPGVPGIRVYFVSGSEKAASLFLAGDKEEIIKALND